jgi:hypothetical protein
LHAETNADDQRKDSGVHKCGDVLFKPGWGGETGWARGDIANAGDAVSRPTLFEQSISVTVSSPARYLAPPFPDEDSGR